MKKIIFYLIFGLLVFIGYCAFRYNATTPIKNNDLIVGISPDYPPYAQIDLETGAIIGLEVDIVTEIARRLHKNLIIKDMPFNSLILELVSGQIDAIAAGITPTPTRKKNVLFSHAYINDDENVVINKKTSPAITALEDLYGKQVAVNIGYTADAYVSKYPEINLIRLKSPSDGFVALQSDSIDAFVVAQSIFENFIKSHPSQNIYQTFTLPGSADACALAYAKYNTGLQAEIDPVIDAMIADGTMLTIQKKWGFA
jgi:ABC-type amino acid transport substrate-binding protein